MSNEPVIPGQTPIPVVIIEAHEGFWDQALTLGTFLLALLTALALLIEIHKDHEIIKALLSLLTRVLPPYRKGGEAAPVEPDDDTDGDVPSGVPMAYHGTDRAGNVPL